MMDIIKFLFVFFGGGTTLAIILLILYVKYPDNLKKIVGQIAFALSYIFQKYEYVAIKNDTEGKINSFVDSLQGKVDIVLPYITIKWTSSDNEKENIIHEDYETIIVMRNRKYKNRNFVYAAYFFMSEIFLQDSKRHLSKNLKTALDLFATKEVLAKESPAVLEQFVADYMNPETEKSDDVREYLKKFYLIEKLGIFFPILVQELKLLGKKVFLEKKDSEILEEVKSLIQYLETWANRRTGQATQEMFSGNYMKCAIKIVASQTARERNSVDNQKDRVVKAIQLGCENVYVLGRIDDGNKQFMEDVIAKVTSERSDVEIKKKLTFKARIKNAKGEEIDSHDYFFHIHNPKAVKNIVE